MEINKIKSWAWAILLLTYLVIRFLFTGWLDSFSPYASYFLEIILVVVAAFLAGLNFFSQFKINKTLLFISLAALLLGFLIFKGAGVLNISIPFDLKGTETIIFLLIVAPILEELIFRFFAWKPIENLNKNLALPLSSILFSYSHLHAIWFMPQEVHNFIYYQTAYTLVLAYACGFSIFRYRSLAGAILIHFMFNFGFYLGSLI